MPPPRVSRVGPWPMLSSERIYHKYFHRETAAEASRNPLGLQHLLDHFAVDDADVVDLGLRPRGHDALDRVVLEIDAGVVVAGVAGLHLPRSDQLVIERPAIQ